MKKSRLAVIWRIHEILEEMTFRELAEVLAIVRVYRDRK